MTNNRKFRRASKAATIAVLRQVRPSAKIISWSALRRREPVTAGEIRVAVKSAGYSLADVLIYEHSGLYAVMYPPEFSR